MLSVRAQDYTDYFTLQILKTLSLTGGGMRYLSLKSDIVISDSSFINRLKKLRDAGYIHVELIETKDTCRFHQFYTLTEDGQILVRKLSVYGILCAVESELERFNTGELEKLNTKEEGATRQNRTAAIGFTDQYAQTTTPS